MTKRWLGLSVVALIALGWVGRAHAGLVESPDPNPFGEVFLAVSTNRAGTVTTTLGVDEPYASVNKVGGDCGQFSMTPTSGLVVSGVGFPITVNFTPASRGAKTCTFEFKSATAVTLGTFIATGTGIERVITLTPTPSANFGAVRVANAAAPLLFTTRTMVIGNTGNTPLDVSALAISGDYSINNPPALPATIGAGGTLNVEVIFDPSAPGTRTTNFTVTSNDQDTPMITAALTGSGTNARIGVVDAVFGVVPNGTIVGRSVVVSNTAAAPVGTLIVTKAVISGSSWFTFAANSPSTCLGSTSCDFASGGLSITTTANVDINCTPAPLAVSGTQVATVTFTSDSDPGGFTVANLSCTAGRPDVTVSAMAMTFADTRINTDSASQTFTITNFGNTATPYSIVKTGANASEFNITGCGTSGSIAGANGFVTCTLTFHPTTLGSKTIGITITTNDPDPGEGSRLISPITGTGVGPQISAPPMLDFGIVDIGSSSSVRTLAITNTGSQALVISTATINPANAQFVIMSGLVGAQTVPTSGMVQWTFTCAPTTQGPFTGNFAIVSDSLTGATTNVTLTCNGQRGVLATAPPSINFGAVPQNMPQQRTVTFQNTGNIAVTGVTGVLSSTLVGYSIDPSTPVPATMNAGAMVPLKINFLPLSGTDGGPQTITFTGTWTGTASHTTMAVLQLDGDGLSADVNVSPATLDFGSFRWNTPQTKTFCIINGSQFSVTINAIAVNPISPTLTGELTVDALMRLQTTCGVGGSLVSGVVVVPTQQVLEVSVTATPASRVGPLAADVMITTNLDDNPTRHVMLTGMSNSGDISVSSMNVDLGAVDVDTGPVTQTVTITNTGQAAFDLGGFSQISDPTITLTLPAATSLEPNTSVTVEISYDPASVAPHTSMVTFPIASILNGPISGAIMIQGRGIDRSFDAAPIALVFPDTFRNPGTTAPTLGVTVTNMGEAVLHVSGVMITDLAGAPSTVFTLVTGGGSLDIPGLSSQVYNITFAPTMAGAAPGGKLLLMSDDDGEPMAEIPLTGTGTSRNVTNPMATIDFGYTGVGIPITLADALSITSMDSNTAFTIRKIELCPMPPQPCDPDEAGPFSIGDTPTGDGIVLATNGTEAFDVTFLATRVGPIEKVAYYYLDQDTAAQGQVIIKGEAVYVDLQGGGGCSSGSGTAGGGVLVLGVLASALRRRRRRLVNGMALGLALGLFHVRPALADPENPSNLDVGVFNPTPSTITGFFQIQTADVGDDGDWVASGRVSYATNPLITKSAQGDAKLIGQRTMFDLGGAYAFLDRFEAGARMPIYTQDGDTSASQVTGLHAAKGTARGDLTLHGKARLLKTPFVVLGASLHLTLPTATDGQYTGVDLPTARVLALGSFIPHKRLTVTVNAGGVLRQTAESGPITQGSGLAWGGSVSFRALDKLWVAGEVFGELMPSGHKTFKMNGPTTMTALSPIEGLIGVNFRVERRITLGLAAGRGLSQSIGAPELRAVFGVTYAPGTPELKPIHPPPPPFVDHDDDADGLMNTKDKCPGEPEDIDQFEDLDGCPDGDNDRDGIADAEDKCPLDGEDKDKFQDEDGCPDKDNDNDGIPDSQDKCVNKPEDKDGFLDVDGCPDPDNDNDGILDDKDKCALLPETINGFQDDDGCPDKGDSLVVLSPDRLETLEAIQFNRNKFTPASINVLKQVAATLRAHPEIIRIRVTTHVQPTANHKRDQETTDKRANVVRDWLIQWGIASSRIEARGFGGTRTLSDAKGSEKVNERLELIILERK